LKRKKEEEKKTKGEIDSEEDQPEELNPAVYPYLLFSIIFHVALSPE
jgi:hypothetical protein